MPVVVVIGGVAIDVVTALAVLIAAYAASIILIKPLTWLLGQIPVIGQNIANALANGAAAFQSWAQLNAKNAVGALVGIVSAPVYWLQTVIGQAVTTAEAIVGQVVSIVQRAEQLGRLLALSVGNLSRMIGDTAARITAVAGSIAGIASRVASAAVAVLEARVAAWLDGIRLTIAQAIDRAHVELGHAIDGVNLRIGQTELGLLHAIDTAVAGVQSWVDVRLRPIEADVAGVKGVVDALPTVATIVGTITAVQVIERIVEDCVKPTCSGIGPSLDVLNALADGTALAAMLALVAESRRDPDGTARLVIGTAQGVEGVVSGILSPALG